MSGVLIVGAESDLVDSWTPELARHGLKVRGHWDWTTNSPQPLPDDVGGVIIIESSTGKPLKEMAQGAALEAGIASYLVTNDLGGVIKLGTRPPPISVRAPRAPDPEPAEEDYWGVYGAMNPHAQGPAWPGYYRPW